MLRDGEFIDIPTSKVVAGDILQVRAGEKSLLMVQLLRGIPQ